jgi:primosomal protein N' (replication factor Y)
MRFYHIAVASLVHSKTAIFTYQSNEQLTRGMIVRVPFGKSDVNGFVVTEVEKPSFATKSIREVLYKDDVLPEPLIKIGFWLSEYYASHLGLVLQSLLPAGLHKKRRTTTAAPMTIPSRLDKDITPTAEQKDALTKINATTEGAFLLHGAPGAGKTYVYIEAARKVIQKEGRSVIILVPEIALTTQLIAEFSNHFEHIFVSHSGMSEADRHKTWESILKTKEPVIVIGPRSALFSPFHNLGLIIIDECHEQSLKQDRSPRYHAIYAASMLAKAHRAKLLLGSATPGISELYLAHKKRLTLLEMPKPIYKQTKNVISIINHQDRSLFTKHRFVSNPLIEAINGSLAKKGQVLIFHNRRGTAPVVICENCGWRAECPTCNLPLTLHADASELRCHSCGYTTKVLFSCPVCKNPTILFKGMGTKLVAQELGRLFPHARIGRFDADNTKDEQLHTRYQELYDGRVDILVGTQIIAKGLDLPSITTVGVLQADSGLHLPDFTANERTFQLLYQVSGRAGRSTKRGTIILQTYLPDNPILQWAAQRDFQSFYENELIQRKANHYPPFRFMLRLEYSAKTEKSAITNSRRFAEEIRLQFPHVQVLGPSPSFYENRNGLYHWQLIIKSKKRSELLAIANMVPAHWQIDLDPVSLL